MVYWAETVPTRHGALCVIGPGTPLAAGYPVASLPIPETISWRPERPAVHLAPCQEGRLLCVALRGARGCWPLQTVHGQALRRVAGATTAPQSEFGNAPAVPGNDRSQIAILLNASAASARGAARSEHARRSFIDSRNAQPLQAQCDAGRRSGTCSRSTGGDSSDG